MRQLLVPALAVSFVGALTTMHPVAWALLGLVFAINVVSLVLSVLR